ncbi:MAG: L-threonylcarbamoyladenylate synthase [Parcubacteria group bacterium]
MKIIRLNQKGDNIDAVRAAVDVFKKGGSVVFPTDTVYGLGCNACDPYVARQLYKIKGRSSTKPLPVFVRNMKWLREVAFIPPKLESVLDKLWPGPITVVLIKKAIIPNDVTQGKPTVAVRIPDYPLIDSILGKFGYPLAVTSANISGEAGSDDPAKILESFKDQLWKPDLILDAGVLPSSTPSTIIDFSKIKPRILRIGPAKPADLEKILNTKF